MAILPASVNSGLCMPLGYFERVNLAVLPLASTSHNAEPFED
jgi:hypothetical protein